MNIEEAIRSIERHMVAHKMGRYPHILIGEALEMAISALRAQQARPLDRSRWEGCTHCNDRCCCTCVHSTKDMNDEPCCACCIASKYEAEKFCPNCGRPLTEAAWVDLERRIGGNDGTADIQR